MATSTEIGRQKCTSKAEPSLMRNIFGLWHCLWVKARCCSCYCCLLCKAVRQLVIHLANWLLFSQAFLNPVLGITSSPEQEGIPVIMCSVNKDTKRHGRCRLATESRPKGVSVFVCGDHYLHERQEQTNKYLVSVLQRYFLIVSQFFLWHQIKVKML